MVDLRALQSASALSPLPLRKRRRVSTAPPGGDSPSRWLQSLALALLSAICPTPGEARVMSQDTTKGVAAQLGPGWSDAPLAGGVVMIHPTYPSMGPVMPAGDGVHPRASLSHTSPWTPSMGRTMRLGRGPDHTRGHPCCWSQIGPTPGPASTHGNVRGTLGRRVCLPHLGKH